MQPLGQHRPNLLSLSSGKQFILGMQDDRKSSLNKDTKSWFILSEPILSLFGYSCNPLVPCKKSAAHWWVPTSALKVLKDSFCLSKGNVPPGTWIQPFSTQSNPLMASKRELSILLGKLLGSAHAQGTKRSSSHLVYSGLGAVRGKNRTGLGF